jgi:UDP-glucose 4-epimerase
MNLLVTGGAGYIGSQTVAALVKQGHQVIVYDNLSTGFAQALPVGVPLVKGDIRDELSLRKLFSQNRFDSLLHFAAKLDVAESLREPDLYWQNNVTGFATLLKSLPAKSEIRSIVFSSTAAVYGDAQQGRPVVDSGAVGPLNPYGETKLECEGMLREFCQESKVSGVVLRYFNVAGAAGDGLNGPRTKLGTTLIKIAAEAAVGRRPQMQIHGVDYPTRDGTCVRDFIHVEDLAELHAKALQWSLQHPGFEIFNCGYGHGSSVREVLQAMKKVSGVDFRVVEGPRRDGDPVQVVADVSKMKAAFGWTPRYDNLEVICRSAYEWEKKL